MQGQPHQLTKRLARLIEAWANDQGLDLVGVGAWEHSRVTGESYILGTERAATAEAPDFVIDQSGDMLDAYAEIGVLEVWLYDGALTVWGLDNAGAGYCRVSRSRCLRDLNLDLVARCMAAPTQLAAIAELRFACYSRMGVGYSP
jgi:hypothetical protein